MPDTPPNPHSRSATATDEQGDTDPDPRRDPRSHSNGEASAGRPATEPVEIEEWDEDEQDNPATDYYAVLNVPRDVLGPLPLPLLHSLPRIDRLTEITRPPSARSVVHTTPSRSASIQTNSRPIAGNAPPPTSTMCWSRTRP